MHFRSKKKVLARQEVLCNKKSFQPTTDLLSKILLNKLKNFASVMHFCHALKHFTMLSFHFYYYVNQIAVLHYLFEVYE